MNEYTEFDTAAEMQKALDRKKAAYGVPYRSLTETTVIDADGIIRDLPPGFDEPRFREQEDTCDTCGNHGSVTTFGDCHKCYYEADADPVNEILGRDERPSQRIFSDFQPTGTQLAAFILAFFLFLALGIDTAMRGDLAAVRFHTEAR